MPISATFTTARHRNPPIRANSTPATPRQSLRQFLNVARIDFRLNMRETDQLTSWPRPGTEPIGMVSPAAAQPPFGRMFAEPLMRMSSTTSTKQLAP